MLKTSLKSFILTLTLMTVTSLTALATDSHPTLDTNLGTIAKLSAPKAAQPPIIIPPAPKLDAKAYVLMDANTGKIIAQKNMNAQLPPASLTKLMTLYVTSQALKQGQIRLDDIVTVSKNAWKHGGSRMFLKAGSHVSIHDLIEGIIVASGNDACVATAEYVGGSEKGFSSLMNQMAQHLNMKHSHFQDSTGLPQANHYTTAHDLALLTRAIINEFPEYYGWYKQKWITYNGIRQPNRNRLLWRDPSVDGLKTGHTQAAGYCLIASAKRQEMRLIAVVMGTPSDASRARDSEQLLNWGFRFYESHQLFEGNTSLVSPRIWYGKHKTSAFGLSKPLVVTVPRGTYHTLKAKMSIPKKLYAPIVKNQAYGKVSIYSKDTLITEAPLIALADNPRAGFFSRIMDHIAYWFRWL